MSVDHQYLDATHALYRQAALTPEVGALLYDRSNLAIT
jgi:hypothetical protein